MPDRPSWECLAAPKFQDLSGEQRMPGVYSARVMGLACAALATLALSAMSAGATSRIKDLANIEGVRQNQLIGYGLVVGLNGTGDTLNNIPFTKQSLQAMLERMGVNIRGATIRTGNVAAVMVTGNLPPFGTQGTRMDVTVSALGDSKNLQGGTLLVTPLLGADGNVYAVAQGSVTINGFQAEGAAASITRGVPTVGRIANGAIIEREIEFALNRLPNVRLALRNGDFTTAKRIAAAINDFLGAKSAEPLDPSGIQGQCRCLPDRDRAVASRTGFGRQDHHRRTKRHHRDGPRRPRRHCRGGAGQPDRLDLGKPASEPAQPARPWTDGGDAALKRPRHRRRQETCAGEGWGIVAAVGCRVH